MKPHGRSWFASAIGRFVQTVKLADGMNALSVFYNIAVPSNMEVTIGL